MPVSKVSTRQPAAKLLALRRLAEAARENSSTGIDDTQQALSPPASAARIQDLRLHQIELEMQNEELSRTSAALDRSRERYFDLYDLAPNGYCTLSQTRMILEANLAAANLLGVSRRDLIKQAFSRFVLQEDQSRYYQWCQRVLQGGPPNACELRMKNNAGAPFWASLSATAVGLPSDDLSMRVVFSDITERKNTEAALQDAQLRLRNLTLRQQEEFDALRMELAHDVHDQLGQTLAALKLEIDEIRSLAPDNATRMQVLIMQGVSTIRDISRALRPIALELGLLPALGSMVAQLSGRSGIRMIAQLPSSLPALPGQVERGLYHIAQEALTNSVLHAGATEVVISLHARTNQVELEISDNGQGFAPDAPAVSRGLGLLGMTERARQLGAELSLQSAPYQGTRISLKLRIAAPGKFQFAVRAEKPIR